MNTYRIDAGDDAKDDCRPLLPVGRHCWPIRVTGAGIVGAHFDVSESVKPSCRPSQVGYYIVTVGCSPARIQKRSKSRCGESNSGIPVPETGAIPLGDTSKGWRIECDAQRLGCQERRVRFREVRLACHSSSFIVTQASSNIPTMKMRPSMAHHLLIPD